MFISIYINHNGNECKYNSITVMSISDFLLLSFFFFFYLFILYYSHFIQKIFNLISFKYYIFVDREVFWDFDIINICPFFLSFFFFFKFSKYNNKTFIDDYHHFKDSHYSFLFFFQMEKFLNNKIEINSSFIQ